jgi:hypothetical protein
MKDSENHQVGIGEKPLLCFGAGSFSRAREVSEVLILGEGAQVILADARQARNLVHGEKFLARLDSDHEFRLSIASMLMKA